MSHEQKFAHFSCVFKISGYCIINNEKTKEHFPKSLRNLFHKKLDSFAAIITRNINGVTTKSHSVCNSVFKISGYCVINNEETKGHFQKDLHNLFHKKLEGFAAIITRKINEVTTKSHSVCNSCISMKRLN